MNNYHIYEEIGRGKYSVVYKGRKKKTIEYVSVKSVERGRRKKLMNEVRIFHNLQHKNILRFHNWYETRNHLWIIFEYCPGGDLFKLLEEDKKLPEPTCRKFAFELVSGLSYLHENGIIYCDLKPSNILINEYSNLKYGDFGLSKKISDLNSVTEKKDTTNEGPKHGAPYYMAPELFQENGVQSFASDFWSLGCVLYEIATGKPPFSTSSLKLLIQMIQESDIPPIPGFSNEFNDLITKLLKKDPLQRLTWLELKLHPIWQSTTPIYELNKKSVIYPSQPQFNKYMVEVRGISDVDSWFQMRNAPPQKASTKVDILRLSMNVHRNFLKDQEENVQDEEEVKQNQLTVVEGVKGQMPDVKLESRRVVLNFGEAQDTVDIEPPVVAAGQHNPVQETKFVYEPIQAPVTVRPVAQQVIQSETPRLQTSNKVEQSRKQTMQNNFVVQENEGKPNNLKAHSKSPVAASRLESKSPVLTKQATQKNVPTLGQISAGNSSVSSGSLTPVNVAFKTMQGSASSKVLTFKKNQPQTQKSNPQRYQSTNITLSLKTSTQDLQMLAKNQLFVSNATSQLQNTKVPHKTLDQLLIHNSDTHVKPIIGNKDIEKEIQLPQLNESNLIFFPWTAEKIANLIDDPQFEAHLSEIYQVLAGIQNINEKLNALIYFESIIINSNVSNRLINSAFVQLLVKMLKQIKSPGVRQRLCSVIGLLVRHSTVIDADLAESEISKVLVETLEERSEKVRRRAIAALGEYMFYAATQMDDEQVDPVWQISDLCVAAIIRCLRVSDEDDIVRFYACKTLENMCAQSNSAGLKFSTVETINSLLAIFLAPNHQLMRTIPLSQHTPTFLESIKQSAAVALSHICRLQPKFFQQIFTTITPAIYFNTLVEGQARIQQAFISMLNLALSSNLVTKLSDLLLAEESFLPSLLKLHENPSIVIRGKCLLTFLLLFKLDFRWLSVVQHQVKFFNVLDRVVRDSYKYVQCCLLCLIDGIIEIVPTVFQTVASEMQLLIGPKNPQSFDGSAVSMFSKLISPDLSQQLSRGGNLFYLSILLDLQTNQIIRNRMLNQPFIRAIAALLDNSSLLVNNTFEGSQTLAYEFQNTLLLVAESISSNQKVLLQMHESIIQYLLPVLLSKVTPPEDLMMQSTSQAQSCSESRFLSLKIMTDILIQLLNEESIYSPQRQDEQTLKLDNFLITGLLPLATHLLQEQDPVPFYGQRLLSALLERNPKLSNSIADDAVSTIVEFYQTSNTNLNKHTIKILKSLLQLFSIQMLFENRIIQKTSALIDSMLSQKQEWCIELLLEINQIILNKLNDIIKVPLQNQTESILQKLIDEMFNNFHTCVQLLVSQPEMINTLNIQERASQNLIQILQLYALCQDEKRQINVRPKQIYFTEQHMDNLIQALKSERKIVQKRVLKCIYWALIQSEYKIKLDPAKMVVLMQFVETVIEAAGNATQGDASLGKTAMEIYKKLQEYRVYDRNLIN